MGRSSRPSSSQQNNLQTNSNESDGDNVVSYYNTDHSNRNAMSIGLNYSGTNFALSGPETDSNFIEDTLSGLGYGVNVVSDSNVNEKGILGNLEKLLNNNGRLFFHYSGHGGQSNRDSGERDEIADNKDEFLVGRFGNSVYDDALNDTVRKNINKGSALFVLIDACNSATSFDLKYKYDHVTKNTTTVSNRSPISGSSVVMISGCRDNQTSVEFMTSVGYQGALSMKFREIIEEESWETYTWKQFVGRLWAKLGGFSQKPQLSSNDPKLLDELVKF